MREGTASIVLRLEREGLAVDGTDPDRATTSLVLDLDRLLVSPDVTGTSAVLLSSLAAHLRGAVREWESERQAEVMLARIDRALSKEDGNGDE